MSGLLSTVISSFKLYKEVLNLLSGAENNSLLVIKK